MNQEAGAPIESRKALSSNQNSPLLEVKPSEASIGDHGLYLSELKTIGLTLRSDRDQPKVAQPPSWFDDALFRKAKSVYERHFMGINFAHLSGLLLLVRIDSIYRTLSATGESDTVSKLFKRYYNTLKHVKTWYEGDIFEEKSDAYRSLLIVRGMHNKVSSQFNDCNNASRDTEIAQDLTAKDSARSAGDQVHVSEYDIMITQFAFIGFIVTKSKNMGLIDDFSQEDLEGLLHFWRVIGYYLGTSEKFNLCSYKFADIVGLCESITEMELKESLVKNPLHERPGIMSVNIVRSLKFIPMLTVYGMMQYLYEILGQDSSELQDRRTHFSRLSYTLIKLVMSRLLAYKPFRSFNNGLTRLSIYLVGKIQDWFSRRLESKYGQELKI